MSNILIRADGKIKIIDFDLMSVDACFAHGHNLMPPEELKRCQEYYSNQIQNSRTGTAIKDKHGVVRIYTVLNLLNLL
jgi:hypothetical protein